MATAKVYRSAPVPPPVREVVLRLTEDEAAAIAVVTGKLPVGSGPWSDLFNLLNSEGVGFGTPAYERLRDVYNGLDIA